ncbi:hypothetical protein HK104_010103 [Borealophlyctis nickersoniae]|nr:hypothetical protein HK104_010103 [Borealophlyctis nickersoniae]
MSSKTTKLAKGAAAAKTSKQKRQYGPRYPWTNDTIVSLLETRLELKDDFEGKASQANGWRLVVERMKRNLPPKDTDNLTWQKAESKFKILRGTVVDYLREKNRSGAECPEEPPYYDTLVEIIGERSATINGPPYRSTSSGAKRASKKPKTRTLEMFLSTDEEEGDGKVQVRKVKKTKRDVNVPDEACDSSDMDVGKEDRIEEDEGKSGEPERKEDDFDDSSEVENATPVVKRSIKLEMKRKTKPVERTPKVSKRSRRAALDTAAAAETVSLVVTPLIKGVIEEQNKFLERLFAMRAPNASPAGATAEVKDEVKSEVIDLLDLD